MLLLDFSLVALSRLQKLLCLESHSICYFLRTGGFEGQALDSIFDNCGDGSATVNFVKNTHHIDKEDDRVMEQLEKYERENERLLTYVEKLKERMAEKENQEFSVRMG